jgi:hypothetical protein
MRASFVRTSWLASTLTCWRSCTKLSGYGTIFFGSCLRHVGKMQMLEAESAITCKPEWVEELFDISLYCWTCPKTFRHPKPICFVVFSKGKPPKPPRKSLTSAADLRASSILPQMISSDLKHIDESMMQHSYNVRPPSDVNVGLDSPQ